MTASENPAKEVELAENEKRFIVWIATNCGKACADDAEAVLKKLRPTLSVATTTQDSLIRQKANFFGLPFGALGRRI